MYSSEIEDLESFIDSYVTTDRVGSNSGRWSRTQSYEDGHPTNVPTSSTHNDGTEIWGQKPGGNEWHANRGSNREMNQNWENHRPKIQNRSVQWQPQIPPEQQGFPQQFDNTYVQEYPQAQGPSQIQAVVSDLIRQNNMNKAQNLPPWVDISRPPPPFPQGIPPQQMQYVNANDPNVYYDPNMDSRYIGQEPILQSMTFQRADVPAPNMPPRFSQPTEFSTQFVPPPLGNESWGGQAHPHFNNAIAQVAPQNWENSAPQIVNQPQPNVQPFQQSHNVQEPPDFHSEIMQGGHFESPVKINPNLPPLVTESEMKLHAKAQATEKQVSDEAKGSQANDKAKESQPRYPNSMLRNSRGSAEDDPTVDQRSHQRLGSEEVFESEYDEGWKTHSQNIKVQISNKKKTVQRKSSAADEDTNWRKKDTHEASKTQTSKQYNRQQSTDGEYRGRRNDAQKSTRDRREKRDNYSKEEKAADFRNSEQGRRRMPNRAGNSNGLDHDNQQRRLTDRGKGDVVSWLEDGQRNRGDVVGKEIRRLQISDSESDLSRFIEMTQAFATTEAKMREVAEIICNKALKEPNFCRNASILCDRMSFMMVHGTKFRSVILNVMQGHYKNRDQLYASSYRRDRRWFGFATFLVEIFLNVRTSSRERLLVLIDPVFNTLFQVLVGTQINKEHIECFGKLFERVGPGLEVEKATRLNELVAEARDRCVIAKSAHVKRVLLHCVELYASKWKLDSS